MMGLNWGNPFKETPDDDEFDHTFMVSKLEAETEKAIAVEGNDGKTVWLPKSQVTMTKVAGEIEISVPGWLAAKQDNITFND